MEKQIDEICRMLRDFIETENEDVRLNSLLFEFMKEIYLMDKLSHGNDLYIPVHGKNYNQLIKYFKQSLKRELKKPEVMNRERGGWPIRLEADYDKTFIPEKDIEIWNKSMEDIING